MTKEKKVITRFETLLQRGAKVHQNPNNSNCDYIEFVEPVDAECFFMGKAYRDGRVDGDNVCGMMSL